MYKYRFSLFTATYNRGAMLEELSNFVLNQTFKGAYEWVIVSDGSTDNTSEIVEKIKAKSHIPIKYINKDNGGKHTAWRVATNVFEGQYVVSCDDDDPITLNMLDVYDKYWSELEASSSYDLFWEVRSRAQYENGQLVGQVLPKPYLDSDYNEVTFRMKKGCEMVGCRKVEVLKAEAAVPDSFLFEDKCSNFPEGIRWSRAARKYKTRFVPEVTRTYVIGHDSLCVSQKGTQRSMKRNYNSLVTSLYSLNEQGDLLRKYEFGRYLFTILQLVYCAIRVNEPIIKYINRWQDKILAFIAYTPGWIIYKLRK